jgi:hypothetical protein
MIKLILFLLLISYTNAESECKKCQLFGECNASYLNYPGKFCNEWKPSYNLTLPCCCPLAAQCINALHTCRCEYVRSPDEGLFDPIYLLFIPVIIFIFIICYYLDKNSPNQRNSNNYTYVSTYDNYNSYNNDNDTYSGDS